MSPRPSGPRKRFYLLHRWTGLLLAFVGMLVFFSGAIATFSAELDMWASRGRHYVAALDVPDFDLDAAYRVAATDVPPKYHQQVDIFQSPYRPILFFFHEHVHEGGRIEEVGVATEIDPATLSVVRRRRGPREEAMKPDAEHAFAAFFVALHIHLLMPETLGLVVTGIAGFALLILIATGILVHRPTWGKLSRKPRTGRDRRFVGELHTLMGSWSLPYTVILALTGSFFSFAGAVLIPVVAMVAFDGDQEALIRTVIGKIEVSDSEETATLNPMLRDARARSPGAQFSGIGLDKWGQPEANATVRMTERSAFGHTMYNYVYDGHTGAFIQEKPELGTQPSLGNTLVMLMAELHFGTLLGIVTKLLWGFFGFATCFIAASGLLVYVTRQRHQEASSTRFVRLMTVAVVGGLPLATACASLAWVGACVVGTHPEGPMTVAFAVALGAAVITGAVTDLRHGVMLTWLVAGFGSVALPVVAPLATGVSLAAAWADVALRSTLLVDGAFGLAGVALVGAALILVRSSVGRPGSTVGGLHRQTDEPPFSAGFGSAPAAKTSTEATARRDVALRG